MKKLIFALCVTFLMLATSEKADARGFGVKAGMTVSSLDFGNGLPGALGYSAGITYQFDLPAGFAIQPDLMYNVKASRLQDVNADVLSVGYIELPVNIQWGLRFADKKIRLFGQVSPFIGYAVAGNMPVEVQSEKWYGINRFSYGAGAGLGIQLWALQVTAQYNWNLGRLANVSETKWSDFNDRNFGGYVITLAVLF
jgi:hypothetical protein